MGLTRWEINNIVVSINGSPSVGSQNEGRYILVIEAYTNTIPVLVSTMLITISPIDSNDNPPTFTSEEYEVSVAENIPIGTNVLQVTLTYCIYIPNQLYFY